MSGFEALVSQAQEPLPRGQGQPKATPASEYALPDHPLRHALNNELHARPPATLSPPETISHLAIHSGDQGSAKDYADLVRLCVRYGVTPPHEGVNHFSGDFGSFRL